MIERAIQLASDALNRARMAIGRGVLTSVSDASTLQTLQLELLADEVAEDIERMGQYGLTSVPFPGAEALMVAVGGLRSHGVVIAIEDRRYRMTGLAQGEVAIYDDQGQTVHLTRAGIVIQSTGKITISSSAEVDVTAPKVVVTSADVELGGAGGEAVARVGDQVDLSTGLIKTGSAKVRSA